MRRKSNNKPIQLLQRETLPFAVRCRKRDGDSPQSEHIKVPLQSRVYRKTSGSRVHARGEHHVLYVLQRQLGPVVPMFVIHVLPNQSVGLHGTVRVDLKSQHGARRIRNTYRCYDIYICFFYSMFHNYCTGSCFAFAQLF